MANTLYPHEAGSVRARRLAAGFSQTQLALAANCSLSSVQLLDRGYQPAWRTAGDVPERIDAALDAALNDEDRAANAVSVELSTDTEQTRDHLQPA